MIYQSSEEERPEPRYKRYNNGVWSVTQILTGVGFSDLSHIPRDVLEAKGDLGTALHKYASAKLLERPRVLKKCIASADERTLKFFSQFDSFLETCVSDYDPIAIEEPLFGDGFAGTPDYFGLLSLHHEAFWALLDWKSRMFKRVDRYQTMAYKKLCMEKYARKFSGDVRRIVVSFTETGFKLTPCTDDHFDWTMFSSARNVWNELVKTGNY
jgi:hypothetical protein